MEHAQRKGKTNWSLQSNFVHKRKGIPADAMQYFFGGDARGETNAGMK